MEPDKRRRVTLHEEQLEAICQRAAEAALEKVSTRVFVFVGKGIVERIFWILLIAANWLYFSLQDKGIF